LNQTTLETIETAEKWIELSNHGNLEGLSKVTANELEVVGPKGIGAIDHKELGAWLKRANLKLVTINRYAKDEFSVLEQQGTWLNSDGTIKGQANVFTVCKIVDKKVTFLARYDNKQEAFKISGLSDEDMIMK
jgi:hypothetical protein